MASTTTVARIDSVIEDYKKDIDRTLLRENLRLTPSRIDSGSSWPCNDSRRNCVALAAAQRMIDFEALLGALVGKRVEFIIVGGAAATAHGSARLTNDLDIVYSRSPENIVRLVDALRGFQPYLRGAPRDLPFRFDQETIRSDLNFTLTTTAGDLDLLGEIAGGSGYNQLLADSITIQLFGLDCLCLALNRLIEVKRAAGRRKDLEAVAELEALREEKQG